MLNRLLITLFYKLYGGRSTRLMATVVHIVPRPSYALYVGRHTHCATAIVQLPLWCNEERFKTYSENRITVIVFSVRRMGIKRSE